MPQFDPSTFATQIFWLLVCFTALYFILWKAVIPRISDVLQVRQEKIEDDLARAEKLKSEAEAVREAYQQAMDEARAKAQGDLKAAADELAAEAAKKTNELMAELAEKGNESEARIKAAQDEALANIQTIAAETARLAAQRLIGVEVSEAAAKKAVSESQGAQG